MVNDLIFKTPESEGLDSKHILKMLRIIEENRVNIHSFMIVRNGNILSEGYYKPFHKDFMHRLYSSSKTYVAMAIGKLIGEGKIKLTDRIIDLLPKYNEGKCDKWLTETTVEDALKMSVPMLTDTYFARDYKEWAWTFFNHPKRTKSLKPAGTVFNYNTSGSFILDVIVEELTGKTFLEYLRPEFDKIGIGKDIWCIKSPDGYAWGGSGVVCTMRDFAKFGELLLNKGEYKGEQLLPRDFVEKATSKQISNVTQNDAWNKLNGYGYQIWITRDGFALLGMGSENIYCFPKQKFMVVFNGDTQSDSDHTNTDLYNIVKYELLENLSDTPIPESQDALKLQEKLNNLTICTDFGNTHSDFEKEIENKKYILEDNPMGWKWFKFNFNGDEGKITYENKRGVKSFVFGLGKVIEGTFPETHYYGTQVDKPLNREQNAIFVANWTEEKKILLRAYIIDNCLGNCFMTFGFKGKEVGLMFNKRAEFFLDDYVGYAGGNVEG